MKRSIAIVISASLLWPYPVSAAQIKQGAKCTKLNKSSEVNGTTFICRKVGGKTVWRISQSAQPKPSPAPSQSAVSSNDLWGKYGWSAKTGSSIIAKSTDEFTKYVSTKRSPNQIVQVIAQDGVDPTLIKWIQDGADLIVKSFSYPPIGGTFYDVVAIDADWLKKTYEGLGLPASEVAGKVAAFRAGAPAFGGTKNNTWNMDSITRNNLMRNDKAGMAQTAGHEFYHAVQENLAGRNPGPKGEEIPNWFWEGPATFIGLQAATKIGAISYESEGRQAFINRYRNGSPINRTSLLSEIRANDGVIDPYAIGFAATELLVANVGVEKFNNIYAELGKGLTFAQAFEKATGVSLDDFYSLFEEVRGALGFPKN